MIEAPILVQMFFHKHMKELQQPMEKINWDTLYESALSELGVSQIHLMTEWFIDNLGDITKYLSKIPAHYLSHSYISEFDIPENIIEIKGNSFSSCKNLTYMTIPKSVKEIQSYAFYNCSNLKDIRFENPITKFHLTSLPAINITIWCVENSYVHTQAKNYGFKCKFI